MGNELLFSQIFLNVTGCTICEVSNLPFLWTLFYSAIKDLNALNLNPTASFNLMKATLIKNTAPIYMVDNFKLKKFF